jgi:hypothetical protein
MKKPLANAPVVEPESGRVFIYPPWVNYSRKWQDLPALFLTPDTWGSDFDLPNLRKVGYAVEKNDHRLFDGPNGGGLIQVFRNPRRWFPRVLFHKEADYRSPAGFPRTGGNSPILAIIPHLPSQHRILGDRPIPRAPSPHVSVEKLPSGITECSVALGVFDPDKFDDSEFRAGFPSLELTLKRLERCPENACDAFAKVDDPRLTWVWYLVQHSGLTPSLWIAALIYLGLRLADTTRSNIRDMLIFTSEYIPNAEFPSAVLWTSRKTKGIIKTVDDW